MYEKYGLARLVEVEKSLVPIPGKDIPWVTRTIEEQRELLAGFCKLPRTKKSGRER